MAPIASQNPVHVAAQYPLHCANEASVTALESPFKLGPLDELVYPFVPIECLFVYRNPASSLENKLIDIKRLRQALSNLLNYYPHLTGRLQINPETHIPEITCIGRGAELREATCDLLLDDLIPSDRATKYLLVTDFPDCGATLTAPFDPSIEGVCRDPVLAIQHTRFACGGVVLGIRLHHILCDAGGFFQLVRGMAEIYRNMSSSSHPTLGCAPLIRSYLWDLSVLSPKEKQEALDYKPTAYYVKQPTESANPAAPEQGAPAASNTVESEKPIETVPPSQSAKSPIIGRVLRFSGIHLLELKELATYPSGEGWVTSFEVLSAYLYQRVYRARHQLLASQCGSPTRAAEKMFRGFFASINMRDRGRLNLGPDYFPNAIYPCYDNFSHELLADGELWMVSKALHDLIRATDAQQMEQTTRWIAVQPDKGHIGINFTFADGNFTVSQWSGFNMYEGVDFDVDGEGNPVPPVLVTPPLTEVSRVDALAMMLSTDEDLNRMAKSGGKMPNAINVNLTLTAPLWPILDEDENFRKHYL